ncbi:MAG: hypothetical protein HY922_17520 [Elusimicrobia bacterium]|nr:hypothetical protein [Elusimicrobiota bacterium]
MRTGKLCLLISSTTPDGIVRLEYLAKFLAHFRNPAIPDFVGFFKEDAALGSRAALAREWVEGMTLAQRMSARKPLSETEALGVGIEALIALKGLHKLLPPVFFGTISADGVLLGAGGSVHLLCLPVTGADAVSDIRSLAGILEAALAPDCPPKLRALLNRAAQADPAEDIASAAGLAEALAELKGRSDILPPGPANKRIFTIRNLAAAALTACGAYWAGFKLFYDILPRQGEGGWQEASPALQQKYGCENMTAPPHELNRNLVENPGLEGPCGWKAYPDFGEEIIGTRGSHSGKYHFRLDDEGDEIDQHIDVSALGKHIRTGAYSVTFSAHMRKDGNPNEGNPYLVGYAIRTPTDRVDLGYIVPVSSSQWTRASHTWGLPAGTQGIRIILQRDSNSSRPRGLGAHFDDVSVVIHPRGSNPRRPD